MSNLPRFMEDDENDTLAFERWEAHVIERYPNPERNGCPDRETLRRFVDAPGRVSLEELNNTHITRCRECVQELQELRRLREESQSASAVPLESSPRFTWRSAIPAVAACLVLILGALIWKYETTKQVPATQSAEVVKVDIDLSGDGVLRGTEGSTSEVQVSLPRRVIDLHLILPYYSPAGEYRITIHKDRKGLPLRSAPGSALANGARTDLQVRVDLHDLRAGNYLLGTTHDGEMTYFYPLSLN